METLAPHTPLGHQVPAPHPIALAKPPGDGDPILDHGGRSTLLGFIHQRRFHLPLICALEGIELHAPSVPPHPVDLSGPLQVLRRSHPASAALRTLPELWLI